ncbi:unnamed protein product [Sphenostylis stenocarpa]|uniref:Uncharacterized protein n=1 Tax=Sphenostylis stenocarpa TaxID=92480 RepID=A0AA86TCD1_9FABA|nr:unnamed protein product [Sphenostylis stenocarpa]
MKPDDDSIDGKSDTLGDIVVVIIGSEPTRRIFGKILGIIDIKVPICDKYDDLDE